jgi:hypothetical protein
MNHLLAFLGLSLLSCVVMAGCGTKQPPPPKPLPQSGIWERGVFDEKGGRPPIVTSHVWMGNQVVFLIVPNFLRAGGGGGTQQSEELRFHGNVVLPDGTTQLTYHAETVNGVVEKVTIADQTFLLENGRTFFVSGNSKPGVKQLDYDPRKLQTQPKNAQEIEVFLTAIPEFEEFLPSEEVLP